MKNPRPSRDCCVTKKKKLKHNLVASAEGIAYAKGLCL